MLAAADPNWFYSTLAQSTAAIVGFAGGFLATRLMALRGEVAGDREALREDFRRLLNEVENNRAHVVAFEAPFEDTIRQVEATRGQTISLAHLGSLSTRGFTSAGTLVVEDHQLEQLRAAHRVGQQTRAAFGALTESAIAAALRKPDGALPTAAQSWIAEADTIRIPDVPPTYWAELDLQREHAKSRWWSLHEGYFRPLQDRTVAFQSRLVPRSTIVLLSILWALLFVGCVVPMISLSAHSGAGKTLLLIGFGFLASAVLAYTAYEVRRIRFAADLSRASF